MEHGDVPQLVLCGAPGWYGAELERYLAELSLADQVITPGHVSDNSLALLYRHAWGFVFPSLYEGFGLPVLEAMASGVPALVSDTGSLREVAAGSAILVSPYDVEALTEALRELICDDDTRESLRTRGLARAAQFPWERTAREHQSIYEEVRS
jgi:glycosyltransferase involved in cell wall biosynthesis